MGSPFLGDTVLVIGVVVGLVVMGFPFVLVRLDGAALRCEEKKSSNMRRARRSRACRVASDSCRSSQPLGPMYVFMAQVAQPARRLLSSNVFKDTDSETPGPERAGWATDWAQGGPVSLAQWQGVSQERGHAISWSA
jgi:hypothetical protein